MQVFQQKLKKSSMDSEAQSEAQAASQALLEARKNEVQSLIEGLEAHGRENLLLRRELNGLVGRVEEGERKMHSKNLDERGLVDRELRELRGWVEGRIRDVGIVLGGFGVLFWILGVLIGVIVLIE